MPSITKTLAVAAGTLAVLSGAGCSSSHSSTASSTGTKSFCANASDFLSSSVTNAPLNTKDKIAAFDLKLRDKANATAKSAPNGTLATSWKTLASYYEASSKGDADAAAKMSQAQQASMGDALQDAQSRCHIDLSGHATKSPTS